MCLALGCQEHKSQLFFSRSHFQRDEWCISTQTCHDSNTQECAGEHFAISLLIRQGEIKYVMQQLDFAAWKVIQGANALY